MNKIIIPNKVIHAPKDTDYVEGTLPGRTLTKDWTGYVPIGERQSLNGFDSQDCTAFGYTNVVEMQFCYFIKHKLISLQAMEFLQVNGYLDPDGIPNFSDRALGSMAGTTSSGNSLNKVADTGRLKGLLPESKWPSVFTTYEEYYKPVPPELQALGLEFLKYFSLLYEYSFSGDVSAAPLYVCLCTCGGWQTDNPVQWCNAENNVNHAVALIKLNPKKIYDSYPHDGSFMTTLGSGYNIPYMFKVQLTIKPMTNAIFAHKAGTKEYSFILPAMSEDALKDKAMNLGIDIMKADGTGIDYSLAKEVTY